MSDLILYHYDMSPFAEKARTMLGYAGLGWYSVRVAPMPPRPELDALTGGYRRIPVAQRGADVFCDTRIIAREIARLGDCPELVLEDQPEAVQAFVRETDLNVFLACVLTGSGPRMLYRFWKTHSLPDVGRFLRDRLSMGRDARVDPVTPRSAPARVRAHIERMETMLSSDFLFGDTPCIADFSAYHGLWFVTELGGKSRMVARSPRVSAWMARMRAFGHGQPEEISAEQALRMARENEPQPLPRGEHERLDQTVTIAPSDYGREPVTGTLVSVQDGRRVLTREHERTGQVQVHFPVGGYSINPV